MRIKLLQLAEGRVLVEQLRLSMRNQGSSVIPTCLIVILLFWVLAHNADSTDLAGWCAAVIISKLGCWLHGRRHLSRGMGRDAAPRVVWALIFLNGIDGAVWGALPWVALDTSTLAGSVLVIAVLAAVAANAMSILSPVLPVFAAFSSFITMVAMVKLLLLGDPAYTALAVAGFLYMVIMLGQSVNTARTVRTSIDLRFENIELMEKLRMETAIAEQARHEAEQANAAKSKFLAAASHDLRQPIHAQGLLLEVLSCTDLSPHQRKLLASASAASEASADMLNTLLDFSRIEAGVIQPQVLPFQMQPLLNKIEREFERQADAKGLSYRSRETDLLVQSDVGLVELILRNLVSNAIRYTDHGGLLVVCRRHGDQAVLEVWDTGLGIEPAQQREVFREFHQLGNPERDRRKGLGLGLAIVDGLVRALGHGLTLTSTPHRGSVFRLLLPLATTAVTVAPAVVDLGRTQMLNVRVLVIDDDESVRAGMLHLLCAWGCECQVAESIEEALELARRLPPDVVVSDYRLREQRTGVEAIVALRQLTGDALPALLITGDTAPDRLREAQASGVPLLHKPVSPSQLYRGLVSVLPY
ncbi:hybrid sensor histidine kinase/response regulator [Rhodoferax ferrireducens]|uniref:ATP-binding response regulator n=1 Tax=Rhodoferax ferrireducens TaxID=192843 RepID=UPI000E0DBBE8|nr:ATP-binding protein [Rhodoferax ferrireducens]